MASILQRLIFVVLPMVILLYPLLRSTPGAYSFANRYRVYRWYQQMRRIEIHLEESTVEELDEYLVELREMEQRLTDRLRVPLFYQRDFYNLRLHLRLVIERCERHREELLEASDDNSGSVAELGLSETTSAGGSLASATMDSTISAASGKNKKSQPNNFDDGLGAPLTDSDFEANPDIDAKMGSEGKTKTG